MKEAVVMRAVAMDSRDGHLTPISLAPVAPPMLGRPFIEIRDEQVILIYPLSEDGIPLWNFWGEALGIREDEATSFTAHFSRAYICTDDMLGQLEPLRWVVDPQIGSTQGLSGYPCTVDTSLHNEYILGWTFRFMDSQGDGYSGVTNTGNPGGVHTRSSIDHIMGAGRDIAMQGGVFVQISTIDLDAADSYKVDKYNFFVMPRAPATFSRTPHNGWYRTDRSDGGITLKETFRSDGKAP